MGRTRKARADAKDGKHLQYAARNKNYLERSVRLYRTPYGAKYGFRPDNCENVELVVYELVERAVIPMRVALEKGHMVRLQGKFAGKGAQVELDV